MVPSLTAAIKEFACRLGFDPVGITTADDFAATERLMAARISAGLMDGLRWFTAERAAISCRPRERFSWARSIIALAVPYYAADRGNEQGATGYHGRVARYAWSEDYHCAIEGKLVQLAGLVRQMGGDVLVKGYVDTGPVAERAVAVRAGIGWLGKNSNVLTSRYGSWVLLAELFTSLELEPDVPLRKGCGQCDRCLRACPTGALVAPYTLDNARCISYLTIELRGSVPRELRPKIGNLIFGCDICQDVCPVNVRAARATDGTCPPSIDPGAGRDLLPLLALDDAQFRQRFRGSALRRAGRVGLQRNVAVALGNSGERAAVPALCKALAEGEPLVRGHAAWALGRIDGAQARASLRRALDRETEAGVREEIERALGWTVGMQ